MSEYSGTAGETGDDRALDRLFKFAGSPPVLPEGDVLEIRAMIREVWARQTRGAAEKEGRPEAIGTAAAGRRRSDWTAGTVEPAVVVQARDRFRISWIAVAASLGLVVSVALWSFRAGAPAPVRFAKIERITGRVAIVRDVPHVAAAGEGISAGSVIETAASDGRASIRFDDGSEIRLDSGTHARILSAAEVELSRGAVYADTGARGRGFAIRTPLGTARDIGTQFSVRVDDQGRMMEVRVREGAVRVASREVAGGTALVIRSDGSSETSAISRSGESWAWVLEASPGFLIEGKTLDEFLTWSSRETGLETRFEPESLETRAAEIVLHGTLGTTRPDRATSAVLAGAGFTGEVMDGVLTIRDGRID